jgi:hypothetical protein
MILLAILKRSPPSPEFQPRGELLLEILWRLRRIEEQPEKGIPQVRRSREHRSLEDMLSELIDGMRRMERNISEIGELSKRVRRIEEALANASIDRRTSGPSSEPIVPVGSVVYGRTARPQPLNPQRPTLIKAEPDAPEESSKPED